MFYINMYMYMSGMMTFIFKCNHFILMLLSFEFLVLSILMMMNFMFNVSLDEFYFMLIFLLMMICESSLGLSLLVLMVRSYGNDYFQSLNILW